MFNLNVDSLCNMADRWGQLNGNYDWMNKPSVYGKRCTDLLLYANYTEQRHLCVYKSLEIMGLEKFNPIIYTI